MKHSKTPMALNDLFKQSKCDNLFHTVTFISSIQVSSVFTSPLASVTLRLLWESIFIEIATDKMCMTPMIARRWSVMQTMPINRDCVHQAEPRRQQVTRHIFIIGLHHRSHLFTLFIFPLQTRSLDQSTWVFPSQSDSET
jgi:hypothetical protein